MSLIKTSCSGMPAYFRSEGILGITASNCGGMFHLHLHLGAGGGKTTLVFEDEAGRNEAARIVRDAISEDARVLQSAIGGNQ